MIDEILIEEKTRIVPKTSDAFNQFLSDEQYEIYQLILAKKITTQNKMADDQLKKKFIGNVDWSEAAVRQALSSKPNNRLLIAKYRTPDLYFECLNFRRHQNQMVHHLKSYSCDVIRQYKLEAKQFNQNKMYPVYINYLDMIEADLNDGIEIKKIFNYSLSKSSSSFLKKFNYVDSSILCLKWIFIGFGSNFF